MCILQPHISTKTSLLASPSFLPMDKDAVFLGAVAVPRSRKGCWIRKWAQELGYGTLQLIKH